MKIKILIILFIVGTFLTPVNVIAGGFASILASDDPMCIAIGALVIMAIMGLIAVASGGVRFTQLAGSLAIVGLIVIIAIIIHSL
ncbi:MAG: hypothetical protein H8E17_03710 [Deltaproteobacteria bacterium]|nr:hypothetical protein [Deltaproteobacteria bacterium]